MRFARVVFERTVFVRKSAADILAVYSAKAHIAPLESRWPILKAVTLLSKDEEDMLLKLLRVAVEKRPLLRKIPLIDFMLILRVVGYAHPLAEGVVADIDDLAAVSPGHADLQVVHEHIK